MARSIADKTKPFQIEFTGYGCFKNSVIYMDMVVSSQIENLYREWRTALETGMPHLLKRYPDRPYHPHLTLAHRDVSPEVFKLMWEYYKEREHKTSVTFRSFGILHQQPAKWVVEEEFFFESGTTDNTANGGKPSHNYTDEENTSPNSWR